MKHIINDTIWHIIDEIIAPFIPISSIGISTKLNTSLQITPVPNAKTGIVALPKPLKHSNYILCKDYKYYPKRA